MCRAMLNLIDYEKDRLRDRELTIRMRARELVANETRAQKRDHYYEFYDPQLLTIEISEMLGGLSDKISACKEGAVVPASLMSRWWEEEVMSFPRGKEDFVPLLSKKVVDRATRAGIFSVKANNGQFKIPNCPLKPAKGAAFIKLVVFRNSVPYAHAMLSNKGVHPLSIALIPTVQVIGHNDDDN